MTQLPARARLLVSSVAGAAFVIVAWALVQVGSGTPGRTPSDLRAGRFTLIDLAVVALATMVIRPLLLAPKAATRQYRNAFWALGVVAVAVALIWFGQVQYDARKPNDVLSHDLGLVYLAILGLITFVAASASSFNVGEGGFIVDQSLPVAIAAYLITGTAGAVIVAAMLFLVPIPGVAAVKSIFNSSVKVFCVALGGGTFTLLTSIHTSAHGPTVLDQWSSNSQPAPGVFFRLVLAVLLANVVIVAANTLLVSSIVSFTLDTSVLAIWGEMARNVGGPLILNSALGLILSIVYQHSGIHVVAMILVLLPLFSARWVFAQIAGERSAQEATLAALIKAVETKDWYTKGHSERVAVAALQIGGSLRLDSNLMRELRFAGMLHDVGKLGVPTGVLIKPGRLDDAEFDAIKRHPGLGQEVVRGIDFLDEAKRGIYYHHERMDGRGYPEGLKGDEIPLFARILGVADAFDSMTQVRSYRGARSVEAALVELDAHRNSQFDSHMVDALVAALDAGWKPDTPPDVSQSEAPNGVPALGVDDDDPSVAAVLAAHRPAKVDSP